MSREIPFFELFAQLQLSPELRLKLLGAVIASACIHQDTLSMELAMIVKHPLEPSDLDELNSAIRNGYGLNEVRFRVTLKEEQLPSQWKAAAAPSAPSGGGPSGPVLMGNPIKVKPVEMKTLDLKMGNATVSGKVFSVECVETRRPGMWRLHVEMTDYTSSVAVHKNLTEKEAKGLDGKINPGMWLCVQGKMEPTWDGKDIQLNPYHINVSTTMNVFGRTTESAASGSGFFITKDGYILTNYHVIEGASTVKVTAYDGTTYDAAVIGGDEDYDIAVIKVEGTNFQPVVIGKSGSVQIGETVAAVGNPLGELTFSMSQGIVSCVNRAINVDGKPFNMIQVDCSINPGNSGGPLFNSYGEVIGIVSAKYSSYSNTTVEGIGFAIPIDDVLAMVKDIMTDGYVTNKPYIGITPQNMTAQMAQQYRYDVTQGVFVCSVEPGSAAEKAGLQMGDVITKIGDTAISDMNDLNAAKKSYRAGDTVTLTIYRAGGTKEVELTFDAVPQTQETAQDNSQQQQQGGSNGGYYYNPWDFFNSFFGNGYYGSSYSGESRDAA